MSRLHAPPTPMDWPHVVAVWHAAFTEHAGVLPDLLLYEVDIHVDDALMAQTFAHTRAVTWWPNERVRHEHAGIQYTALRHPAWLSILAATRWGVSSGEATTAVLLATCDTHDAVAGVLIAASIHHRVPYLPRDTWPSYHVLQDLQHLAWRAAGIVAGDQWHHRARTTLPYLDDDDAPPCPTVDAFVTLLGREHAELFRRFRPVQLVFGAGDAPLLAAVRQAIAREAAETADADAQRRQQQEAEQAARAVYEAQHSRWREWPIGRTELEVSVWSLPTTEVARLFGVSDVAIGKRCRQLVVAKPPPGFWRTVETGAVPHPQGKPPARGSRRRT